jgi:hypothetical protein
MAQIIIEVSDAVKAKADEAAVKYGHANAGEWGKVWLKDSLVGYAQQQHTAEAQKAFDKSKRAMEALFDEE